MNKNFLILIIFLISLSLVQGAGIKPPPGCLEGATSACTNTFGSQVCDGIQTCSGGIWGACIDKTDSCPQCQPIGTTSSCTTGESCPGTKTCSGSYLWSSCVDNPEDSCPSIASLSVQWQQPSSNQTIGVNGANEIIIPKVYCNNGPCNDIIISAQYCVGSSCSNYKDFCDNRLNFPCTTTIGAYRYWSVDPGETGNPDTAPGYNGSYYYSWWYIPHIISPSFPYEDYYGQTIRLRLKATSSNAPTAYATGRSYYVDSPATVNLISPSTNIKVEKGEKISITWSFSDPEGDAQRSRVFVDGDEKYDSGSWDPPGEIYRYDWTVPQEISSGEHEIEVTAYYVADGVPDQQTITIVECKNPGSISSCTTSESCPGDKICKSDNTWSFCTDIPLDGCPNATSAEMLTPVDGNAFYIGSNIEFKSYTNCASAPCIIRWDSNKDIGWHSTDENNSYNGLSIGNHKITLTVTDAAEETKTDSADIIIKPIPADVLSVSDFQITKIDPENRFAVNSKIRVHAKVNYFLNESINAKAFLIISDPRTGQAVYGPEPFYLNFSVPSFEEYDLNIDLGNYDFDERENYKIEFLIVSNYVESSAEYFVDPMNPLSDYWADGQIYFIPENQIPEQNKANNSGYEIIELGPAVLRDISSLPETNSMIILLIVFGVLIISRKRKKN